MLYYGIKIETGVIMEIKSLLERGAIPPSYWIFVIGTLVITCLMSIYYTRKYNKTKQDWSDGFIGDFSFIIFCFGLIALLSPFVEHILVKM